MTRSSVSSQLYFDGFDDGGSVEKFERCFYTDAWILFTDSDGELHKTLISDCFEDWAGNDPVEARIISVIQAGDVARVLLRDALAKRPGRNFLGGHTLAPSDQRRLDGHEQDGHSWLGAGWAGAVPARGEEAAEAPDRDEIVRVVQLYIDGFNNGDAEVLREAFHPDARIAFTERVGELQSWRIYDRVEEWGPTDLDDPSVYGRIIDVTQAGEVACVVLGFDWKPDLSDGWVDIHQLLKLDGTWKITNKTATHASRAAWAAPAALSS